MAKNPLKWRSLQKMKFSVNSFTNKRKSIEDATSRHARKFIVRRIHRLGNVSRAITGWVFLVTLLTVLAIGQPIFFSGSAITKSGTSGGTYAEGMRGPLQNLNPLYATTSAEVAGTNLIFSSLYSYDSTGHLKGDVAQSLSVDESGKKYTVKIAPNLRWSDGEALTAKDVAFTVELMKNPVVRSNGLATWRTTQVEQVDDTTLIFTLPNVYASFPTTLTFGILPQHILGAVAPEKIRENNFSKEPVGSGPYKLKFMQTIDASDGRSIATLEQNGEYHGRKPKASLFKIYAFNDETQIVKSLKDNEINAASDIGPFAASQLDQKKYEAKNYSINSGVYAFFNTTSGAMKDIAVRRALQIGINTAALRANLSSHPEQLSLPLLPGQTDAKQPEIPAYDSAKAAQLLEEAGWKFKDGDIEKTQRYKDGNPLEISVVTGKNANYEKSLESFVNDARKLGIKVTTQIYDQNDPTQNITQLVIRPRAYDVFIYEISLGSDPDVLAYWDSSQASERGFNLSNYNSPIVNDSLQGARSTLDANLRSAKYAVFMKQWIEDAPAIGLYQAQATYVKSKNIETVDKDIHSLVSPSARFEGVSNWSVDKKSVYKTP